MNGSKAFTTSLLGSLSSAVNDAAVNADLLVCVPFPYLQMADDLLGQSEIACGAQQVSEHESGAYTGEVSAGMLKEFGCTYCLVGHSERRTLYNESGLDVANKYAALLAHDITPVLCVGETLEERESGQTDVVVQRQIQEVLDKSGIESLKRAVIAYEPVWAIGTGKTATPEQAQQTHQSIRESLAVQNAEVAAGVQILYGGSMNASNAADLLSMEDIDGGLIGGASLKAEDFLAICRAA